MVYGQYGKWSISVENERIIQFYDRTKWRAYYCGYQVIPAGVLINSCEVIDHGIPTGAVKKAEQLIKKYDDNSKAAECSICGGVHGPEGGVCTD